MGPKKREIQARAKARRESMLAAYEAEDITLTELALRYGISYAAIQQKVKRAQKERKEVKKCTAE